MFVEHVTMLGTLHVNEFVELEVEEVVLESTDEELDQAA